MTVRVHTHGAVNAAARLSIHWCIVQHSRCVADHQGILRAEKISRSMLYRAWKEGWGPRFYRVGVTRRITQRARLEWQHEREANG